MERKEIIRQFKALIKNDKTGTVKANYELATGTSTAFLQGLLESFKSDPQFN